MVSGDCSRCRLWKPNLVERQPQFMAADLGGSADDDRDLDSVNRQSQAVFIGDCTCLVVSGPADHDSASGRCYSVRSRQIRSSLSLALYCRWFVLGDTRLCSDDVLYWWSVLRIVQYRNVGFSARFLAKALWGVVQPLAGA